MAALMENMLRVYQNFDTSGEGVDGADGEGTDGVGQENMDDGREEQIRMAQQEEVAMCNWNLGLGHFTEVVFVY